MVRSRHLETETPTHLIEEYPDRYPVVVVAYAVIESVHPGRSLSVCGRLGGSYSQVDMSTNPERGHNMNWKSTFNCVSTRAAARDIVSL